MVDITAQHWYTDIFRSIMAGLDKFIYSLLSVVYNVLFKVAGAELLDGNLVKELFGRIQLILGVIILFKVAISLFNGIMNPDSLKDSKNGFSGVIKRVVTVLIMMILIVPLNIPVNNNDKLEGQNSWNVKVNSHGIIFGTLYELQRRVLEDNVIGKLITGINENSNTGDVGENFSRDVLKSFLTVSVVEDGADISDMCQSGDTKCVCGYNTEDVKYDVYFDESSSPSKLLSIVNGWCNHEGYGGMSQAAKNAGVDEDAYAYSYSSIWSTIIGVLFVFLVLSLTIDIAVRVFKLAMLQLLAPIPILSYIDPKSEQTFKNWTKTLTQVYLDLFVRLAIISFIIFIFNNLSTEALSKSLGTGFIATVSKILIYLGIIMFAKQAPKFITDTLGIKAEGFGGLFSGLAGLKATVSGGVSGVRSAYQNTSGSAPKRVISSLVHGTTGAVGAAVNAGAGDSYADISRRSRAYNDKLWANAQDDSTFMGRVQARMQSGLGLKTNVQKMDDKIKHYNAAKDAWTRVETALNSDDKKMAGINEIGYTDSRGYHVLFNSVTDYSVKDVNDILNNMKSSGQYSAEELDGVSKQLKKMQADRFKEIAIAGDSGQSLQGTEGQVYQGAQTIYQIGIKYSNEVQNFEEFKNAKGMKLSDALNSNTVSMPKNFKGGSYDAGRDADAIKASTAYAQAQANARRADDNKK